MGGRGSGRKPLPTAVKQLNGTFEITPHRRNLREPIVPSERPECPAHLQSWARVAWNDLCDTLEAMGCLSTADAVAMECFATSYETFRNACAKCSKVGDAIPVPILDKDGNRISAEIKRNPYYTVKKDMMLQLTKLCAEFGLTPSSRTRVQIQDNTASEDPFADFFKARENPN